MYFHKIDHFKRGLSSPAGIDRGIPRLVMFVENHLPIESSHDQTGYGCFVNLASYGLCLQRLFMCHRAYNYNIMLNTE